MVVHPGLNVRETEFLNNKYRFQRDIFARNPVSLVACVSLQDVRRIA
jgi:hypothetical protein